MITLEKHPTYHASLANWNKWRCVYESGDRFIEMYLQKYSTQERDGDFKLRKSVTYCPAFAKQQINEVNNSIFQRMEDISRIGGSPTYVNAVNGVKGGVDLQGSSMDLFIGQKILPELLVMSCVGVMVDMPELTGNTLLDSLHKSPFLTYYVAEDICNWSTHVEQGEIIYDTLQVRDVSEKKIETIRTYTLTSEGVLVEFTDTLGRLIKAPYILKLTRIPFVMFKISNSLLADIANYQIALLNMSSSDVSYILRSNFPFYVEQYDPRTDTYSKTRNKQVDDDGKPIEGETVNRGTQTGVRYATQQAPQFIHPSSEPLQISMKKQEQMKEEMRQLLALAISSTRAVHASAESKSMDLGNLENGLSYIGLELEHGEQMIADRWAEFEATSPPAKINYPTQYSIKSDAQRRQEAKDTVELVDKVPSKTFRNQMLQRVSAILLSHHVTRETLQTIYKEIENSKYMTSDPKQIALDLENGLVSTETASEARGYPKGEVEQAEKDHAARIKRIQEAQSPTLENPARRGVPDLSVNPKETQVT